MIDDGEEIPAPEPANGENVVGVPLLTALKVELYRALRQEDITRAELARRLGWNRESDDRLFRLDHRSRLEQIEAAFHPLHRTIDHENRPGQAERCVGTEWVRPCGIP